MVGWSSLLDYLFLPMITFCWRKSISPPSSRKCRRGCGGNLRRHFNRRESEERQPGRNFNTLFVLVQISIMVVFIFRWFRDCIKEKALARSGRYSRYQRERASDSDYYRGDDRLLLFLGFDAVTTLSEETPDAARGSRKPSS